MEGQRGMFSVSGVVLLILLSLAIPLAFAEKQEVFSGEVYSGGTGITDLGENFSAFLNLEETAALIVFPDAEYIVEKYDCETKNNRTICVSNLSDLRGGNLVWTLTPRISLTISQDLTGLSIIKKSETKELNQYEIANIEIKLQAMDKNIGSAELNEDYPDSVEVFNLNGCEVNKDNTITWTGPLQTTSAHYCSYSVKALKEDTFSVSTDVSYHNGVKTIKQSYTESYVINGPAISIVENAYVPKENKTYSNYTETIFLKLGDVINLTANLTAVKGIHINNYSLSWQKNFNVLSRNKDSFYYQNFMQESTHMYYTAKLEASRNGSGEFYVRGLYLYKGRENYVENSIPYQVVVEMPSTMYSFDTVSKKFTAALVNPTNLTFNNITISGSSQFRSLGNRSFVRSFPLWASELGVVLTDEEIAKDELSFTYRFETEYGEVFTSVEKVSVSGKVVEEMPQQPVQNESAPQTPQEETANTSLPGQSAPATEKSEYEKLKTKEEGKTAVKQELTTQRKMLYIIIGSVFALAILFVIFFMVRDRLKEKIVKKKSVETAEIKEEKKQDPLYKQFGTAPPQLPEGAASPRTPFKDVAKAEEEQIKEEVKATPVSEKDIKEDVMKMEHEKTVKRKAKKKGKKP